MTDRGTTTLIDDKHRTVDAMRRAIGLILALLGIGLGAVTAHAQDATEMPRQGASPTIVIGVPPHGEPVLQELLALDPTLPGRFVAQPMGAHVGFRQLCRGGDGDPRALLTMRPMPAAIARDCPVLEMQHLVGVRLGRDPIILAMRADSRPISLTTAHLYQALARDVSAGDEFRRNVAIRWSDIDRALPPIDIRFQLPPPSDHRRHIFETMVLEDGCRGASLIKSIYEAAQRSARCITTRIDRVREIAREHAVRSLIEAPAGTIGVVGPNEMAEADGKLIAVTLSGVAPTQAAMQSGAYGFSTTQWLYAHLGSGHKQNGTNFNRDIARLTTLAASEVAIGPRGSLAARGLVPSPPDEREAQRSALQARDQGYDLAWFAGWVGSIFTGTWSLFGQAVSDLRGSEQIDAVDLAQLMDIAGYKLTEFESTVGLIPGAGMTFKITREMSESDRDFLERELYRDARARPGLRPAMQRRLIQAIVEISESEGYQVSKVEVTFLPLPAVKLSITPRGSGGSDTASVLRAIERIEERLPEALR